MLQGKMKHVAHPLPLPPIFSHILIFLSLQTNVINKYWAFSQLTLVIIVCPTLYIVQWANGQAYILSAQNSKEETSGAINIQNSALVTL